MVSKDPAEWGAYDRWNKAMCERYFNSELAHSPDYLDLDDTMLAEIAAKAEFGSHKGSFKIERKIPMLPFSKEVQRLEALKSSLALYRLVFGQPRQEELLAHLHEAMPNEKVEGFVKELAISLEPP
jgi:hypothetical protein